MSKFKNFIRLIAAEAERVLTEFPNSFVTVNPFRLNERFGQSVQESRSEVENF
jgi:hypothetical protein